jgi:hypothetical protein
MKEMEKVPLFAQKNFALKCKHDKKEYEKFFEHYNKGFVEVNFTFFNYYSLNEIIKKERENDLS